MRQLHAEAADVARHLQRRAFTALASALRARTGAILEHWRRRSIEVMPRLDRLTNEEFEDSIPQILAEMATALEHPGAESVRRFIEASPAHGSARFVQSVEPHVMLAEERILRSVIILEMRDALGRPLGAEEAAAFHELFDLMGEYSLLKLMQARGEARDRRILDQFSGMQRLADLGTLAAGLAHDAANLMLPIRTRLDFLASAELPPDAREDINGLLVLMDHLQDFITNLRMLSVDPHRATGAGPADAAAGDSAQARDCGDAALDVSVWWGRVSKFHRRMLPPHIELKSEVPAGLPRISIAGPVLSQAAFNLIRNAQNAMHGQEAGCITVRAAAQPGGSHVDLIFEDDGPGMTAEVLAHCFEPFFSGDAKLGGQGAGGAGGAGGGGARGPGGGTGLGLAIVSTMVVRCGGRVTAQSPPPGKPRGARFILSLPAVQQEAPGT